MNIALLYPELTLFIGALLILMADVFFAKKYPNFAYFAHFISLIICAIAITLTLNSFVQNNSSFSNMFVVNGLTGLVKVFSIMLLTLTILFSLNFTLSIKKISSEYIALLMISVVGGMFLISANDFIVFYLALELQALSLYLLAAINRQSRLSSEAGMKYFILGSVASGILLFGISLIYGFSGTTNFSALQELYSISGKSTPQDIVPIAVIFGFVLVISAMFFKVSAAPFHMWAPDVYQGSATAVTTFFATVVKFISVLVLMNLCYKLVGKWPGIDKILIFGAILSLAVGSFGAIFQKNVKRLLAYSSIGHVGFALLGIAAFSKIGNSAVVLYMIIYSLISLGCFGFLNLIRGFDDKKAGKESDEENEKLFNINSFAGLSKRYPVMAFAFATLMFSSAGIPPLAGFFSKFYILSASFSAGMIIVPTLAVIFSVVSAYYYIRIVKIMYFDEADEQSMKFEDIPNIKFIVLGLAILNIILIFFLKSIMSMIMNFTTI